MVLTTRKIWTQKILESPYKKVNNTPYKFVSGVKYEDTGAIGSALDFGVGIPTISSWERTNTVMNVGTSFVNSDATSSITNSTQTIVWKGQDLTGTLSAGDEFLIENSQLNNGKYTIDTISYGASNTTIVTVEDSLFDETVLATVANSTTVTTQMYYNTDDTSSAVASTKTIVFVGQDVTGELEAGDTFWLTNTTSNNKTFTVDTVVYAASDSTIVVLEDTLVNETFDNPFETFTFTTDVIHTNNDATSAIVALTGVITLVAQDWSTHLTSGDSIVIANCTNAGNNVTFEIDTIDYNVTTALATVITVVDPLTMVDETLNGSDETITVNTDILYTNDDITSSAVASTKTFTIVGQDATSNILADDTLTIAGSVSNDGSYTVVTCTHPASDTIVVVSEIVVDETFTGAPEQIRTDTN